MNKSRYKFVIGLLRFITLIFLVNFWSPSIAQDRRDSLGSAYFDSFDLLDGVNFIPVAENDTVNSTAFFYDRAKAKLFYLPRTGNPGSASLNIFSETTDAKVITDGFNQFAPYLLDAVREFPSGIKAGRFTNIDYHLGSKKEQHIFILHEQKIRPWLRAGLDFGALTSPGDFSRQLNKGRNFDIWFAYESQSGIYRTYLSFTSNRIENQENGGITADSSFEEASSLDTRTLPINLRDASVKHRTRDYLLKQEINLSRLFGAKRSKESPEKFQNGSFVFSNSLWWNRKSILFNSTNPDSGYFNTFNFDSTITKDTSFYNDLYSQSVIRFSSRPTGNGTVFSIGAGFNLQYTGYFTNGVDTSFSNGNILMEASLKSSGFAVQVSARKSITGDFNYAYLGSLLAQYFFNGRRDFVFLNLETSKLPQPLRDRIYYSNHFIWNNDFSGTTKYESTAGIYLSRQKLGVAGRFLTAKNMVFYREDYLPQDYGKMTSAGEISVSKIFNFGKFGMYDKLIYSVTGNDNVIRLPSFALFASAYYQNLLFKKALGLKTGVDVAFHSKYDIYGYMPATGIFYLQDEKKTGDYPMAGVFVSLRIKTATLFIRIDHVNAGLGTREYYGAYHYPLPGRSFKFGVNWNFSD